MADERDSGLAGCGGENSVIYDIKKQQQNIFKNQNLYRRQHF